MTPEDIGPLKAIAIWAFIIVGGLATACISFICFVSIWEGFAHIHQSGSWVPIVAGTVVFGMAAWAYVRLAKAFHRRLTREELLNL